MYDYELELSLIESEHQDFMNFINISIMEEMNVDDAIIEAKVEKSKSDMEKLNIFNKKLANLISNNNSEKFLKKYKEAALANDITGLEIGLYAHVISDEESNRLINNLDSIADRALSSVKEVKNRKGNIKIKSDLKKLLREYNACYSTFNTLYNDNDYGNTEYKNITKKDIKDAIKYMESSEDIIYKTRIDFLGKSAAHSNHIWSMSPSALNVYSLCKKLKSRIIYERELYNLRNAKFIIRGAAKYKRNIKESCETINEYLEYDRMFNENLF